MSDSAVALDFLNGHNASQNGHARETAPSNGTFTASDDFTPAVWQSIAWDESAPKKLIKRATQGDLSGLADEIAKTLRPIRKRHITVVASGAMPHPASLMPSRDDDALPASKRWRKLATAEAPAWKRHPSAKLSKLSQEVTAPWLAAGDLDDTLTAAWSLMATSSGLSDDVLISLWLALLQSSRRTLNELSIDTDRDPSPADCTRELQAAELSVISGLIFRHIVGATQVAQRGADRAEQVLDAATDNDGTPHADWWPRMSAGVLSALRLLWLDAWWGERRLLRKPFRDRLRKLLKQAVALNELQEYREAVVWGLTELGTKPSSPAMQTLTASGTNIPAPSGRPASHSGWASLGVMRSRWGSPSNICTVGYASDTCRIDFQAAGHSMLRGPWTIDLSVSGQPISFTEEWKLMCWNSDKDGDYLELGRDVKGQVSLIRQFFLSRTDSFLYLTDSIRAEGGPINYHSQLPLLEGWQSQRDSLTREFAVDHNRTRVRVLPVSLPQYVAHASAGRAEIVGEALQMSAETSQAGLTSAIMLEWSAARRKWPVDWSLLSVAEEGKKLDSSEAFGSRVRIGDSQFMFFRSLTKATLPRSVMGHHTPYESVIAEFDAGQFKPLVNVEI